MIAKGEIKIIVRDASTRDLIFQYYSDIKPEIGEFIGFLDELYKIVSIIHIIDEYGNFEKMKVLVIKK